MGAQPFVEELKTLINKHSMESRSATPDFILAEYLQACLHAFEKATIDRERWYHEGECTFPLIKGELIGKGTIKINRQHKS